MQVTIVHINVRPEHIDEFVEASRLNHEASIQEPGNLRFDLIQSTEDAGHFVFYEAYRSAADVAAHKQTDHYRAWRDTVADWMAEPRRGVPFRGLYLGLDPTA